MLRLLLPSSVPGFAGVKRIVPERLPRVEERNHHSGPRAGKTQAELSTWPAESCASHCEPGEHSTRSLGAGTVFGTFFSHWVPTRLRQVAFLVSPTSWGEQGMLLPWHLGLSLPAMRTRSKGPRQGPGASMGAGGGWRGVGVVGRGWGEDGVQGGSVQSAERAAGGVEDRRWGPGRAGSGQWSVAWPHWYFRQLISKMSSGHSS